MAQERRFPIGSPILEVKNVSLSFGGVKAITNASFSILTHEIKAIIGCLLYTSPSPRDH